MEASSFLMIQNNKHLTVSWKYELCRVTKSIYNSCLSESFMDTIVSKAKKPFLRLRDLITRKSHNEGEGNKPWNFLANRWTQNFLSWAQIFSSRQRYFHLIAKKFSIFSQIMFELHRWTAHSSLRRVKFHLIPKADEPTFGNWGHLWTIFA